MDGEVERKWLGKLAKLNPATGNGACRGRAPHKPLLLLCLLDMAEAGELRARSFTRTAGLVLRFKTYGALVTERWPTRLDLRKPFYHLKTQGFWIAYTMDMRPAQSSESCFVCEIDDEFFQLMGNADFRLKARLLLISRYFEPKERVALLESLGLTASRLGRVEHRMARLNEEAEDAARKLEFDLFYVKNHSLLLDLLILAKSVRVVLSGWGAR